MRRRKPFLSDFGVERFEPDGQNADDNDREDCSSPKASENFDDLASLGSLSWQN
jgi:hypothetical protein